jgi:hypothetical protein
MIWFDFDLFVLHPCKHLIGHLHYTAKETSNVTFQPDSWEQLQLISWEPCRLWRNCSFSNIWTLSFHSSRIKTWSLGQHSKLPGWVRHSIGQSVRGLIEDLIDLLLSAHSYFQSSKTQNTDFLSSSKANTLLTVSSWPYSITRKWLDSVSSVLLHLAQF